MILLQRTPRRHCVSKVALSSHGHAMPTVVDKLLILRETKSNDNFSPEPLMQPVLRLIAGILPAARIPVSRHLVQTCSCRPSLPTKALRGATAENNRLLVPCETLWLGLGTSCHVAGLVGDAHLRRQYHGEYTAAAKALRRCHLRHHCSGGHDRTGHDLLDQGRAATMALG